MSDKAVRLGLFLAPGGYHVAGWRAPETIAETPVSFVEQLRLARLAEQACFDFLFLADNEVVNERNWSAEALARTVNRFTAQFEPLTLLAAIAAQTSHIGLIATVSATFAEPYTLARQMASLDLLSGGRAGWNVVTAQIAESARNFSRETRTDHASRYELAGEFVDVVLGLWRSWDDDAFVMDKISGRYFDPAKRHRLDHAGRHYRVAGPLNVPRSPQGHPVIVQAGSSVPGRALAARTAEVIFTAQYDKAQAQAFTRDVKSRAEACGRAAGLPRVMPGLVPVIGSSRQEAIDKYEALQDLVDTEVGLSLLSSLLGGADLRGADLDAPLPADLPVTEAIRSRQDLLSGRGRTDRLTVRELIRVASGTKGHRLVFGTAGEIADQIEDWVQDGAADGFCILPLTTPGSLLDFTGQVVPELQRRGAFRRAYDGPRLRDHLGLPFPPPRRRPLSAQQSETSKKVDPS